MGSLKWIVISDMNLRICSSSVFSNDFIYHFFCFLISIWWSLNKYVSHISILDFLFGYLDFCSTFHLQLSNGVSTFTYNKADAIIWNWNDISIWRRRSVWCHHTVIHRLIRCDGVINLSGNCELFFSDLISSSIICWYYSFYSILCPSHTLRWISYDQHVLFIIIIRLWSWTFFLRTLASY